MSGETWNDSILRVMLEKLSKSEVIELLIVNIKVVCGDDEKHLKEVTHEIVCHAQCTEILAGRLKLEEYQEPHRRELFARLLGYTLGKSLDDKAASIFYEDYKKSKLAFLVWTRTLAR